VRRFSAADLPEVIPVFPLPGALLLPRGRLPLNIFEPRYLAMLDDALKTDHRLIGMIQPYDGDDQPPRLHAVGCAGRITSLTETEDGRYLIMLSGVARFRIAEEREGFAPYRRVQTDWTDFHPDLDGPESLADFDRENFLVLLQKYLEAAGLSSDWEGMREAEDEMLINTLSMMCPFAIEEKQALLEAATLVDRAGALTALIQFAIAEGGEGGALQ